MSNGDGVRQKRRPADDSYFPYRESSVYLSEFAATVLEAQSKTLRDRERGGRETLRSGLLADLASFDELYAQAFVAAQRRYMTKALANRDFSEPAVAESLSSDMVASISAHCRRAIGMSANLRYRARCAVYSDALLEAERVFIDGFAQLLSRPDWQRLRSRPHISRPHLDLRVVMGLPQMRPPEQMTDGWIDDLRVTLSAAVRDEVRDAYRRVTERGATSMARAQAAVASALIAAARR